MNTNPPRSAFLTPRVLVWAVFLSTLALGSPAPAATAAPPPASTPTPCGSYGFTVSTGSIVPGTVDTGNHVDDDSTAIPLPFTYSLYDQTFASVAVGSNGHLTFGAANNAFNPGCLPIPASTYAIFPYETDMCTGACSGNTGTNLGIFTSTTGSAPNRIFNIEWRAAYYNSGQTTGVPINFEVRLFENQTAFDVIYGTVPPTFSPPSARILSVGTQRTNTTNVTSVGCDTTGGGSPPVSSGQKYHYTLGAACPCGSSPWTTVANYPAFVETPAVGTDGTFAYSAGGYNGTAATNGFYRYDPVANSWSTLPSMPASLYAARGVFAQNTNSFYVFGGYNGSVTLNTTYRYDVATNSWSTGAAMPAARSFASVVYYPSSGVSGQIYVMGGFDAGGNEMSSNWIYDTVANTWNAVFTPANIPVAMAGSGATIDVDSRFVYLAGSFGAGSGSTLHYRYDIQHGGWTALAPLPTAIFSPVTGLAGGSIFVSGGGNPYRPLPGLEKAILSGARGAAPDTSFSSTYLYDIAGNSWTFGPSMNAAHSYTSGTSIGKNLLVVAGYNGSADSNAVEINAALGCSAAPTPCPGPYNVLIIYADNALPSTLPSALQSEPGISPIGIELWNAGVGGVGTPPLGSLLFADIVVVWSNAAWADPVTLGNNLGSAVAGGAVVVTFNFDWFGGAASILGTWATTYSPFTNPGTQNFVDGTLGSCTFATLCTGVSSLNAHFRETMNLASGATLAGSWNDGTPMIATKGRAVAVSAYVGDNPTNYSGQFSRVIANAGRWLKPPCPATADISGTVTYCDNPALPTSNGVLMTLTGTAGGSTSTTGAGAYSFVGLTSGGSYTVTPTKTARTPGSAGINTLDVIAVQKHFLGSVLLTGCRLTAANVAPPAAVNTLDVIAVQHFFLGQTAGIQNTGKYVFSPVNRTYSTLSSTQTAQNFDELILGDVAGPFISPPRPGAGPGPDETGAPDSAGDDSGPIELPSAVASVALPDLAVDRATNYFIAPVTTSAINARDNLIGFQGDFNFDSTAITFQDDPVQPAGLTAEDWNVSGAVLPGQGKIRTLRVSAFSNTLTPLSGLGTLFELRMIRVNKADQTTQLFWANPPDHFLFIDHDLNTQKPIFTAPGSIEPGNR